MESKLLRTHLVSQISCESRMKEGVVSINNPEIGKRSSLIKGADNRVVSVSEAKTHKRLFPETKRSIDGSVSKN